MATTVKENNVPKLSADDAALEMVRLLEGHFDELGLTESERDERYARAQQRLDAINAEPSTSAA